MGPNPRKDKPPTPEPAPLPKEGEVTKDGKIILAVHQSEGLTVIIKKRYEMECVAVYSGPPHLKPKRGHDDTE